MNQPNTIYEIRYDFDLNGATIEIPDGCTLKFEGGMLRNGVLKNCPYINACNNKNIFNNVNFIAPHTQTVAISYFGGNQTEKNIELASMFGRIDFQGKSIKLTRTVKITNDVELFNGNFHCSVGHENIKIYGTDTYLTNYKHSIKENDTVLQFAPENTYKGVLVTSSDNFYSNTLSRNGKKGELVIIERYEANKTVLKSLDGFSFSYDNDIKLLYFNFLKVNIHDCSFISDTYEYQEDLGTLLSIAGSIVNIYNCQFQGLTTGIDLMRCINSNIHDCKFKNIYWGIGFTYGTSNSTVNNCTFNKGKHAWTTLAELAVAKNNNIHNNIVSNHFIGICPHANAYNTKISENLIENGTIGIGSYAPLTTISNNVIRNLYPYYNGNKNTSGIYMNEAAFVDSKITGNLIENISSYGVGIAFVNPTTYTSDFYKLPEFCVICNNIILNCVNSNGINADFTQFTNNIKGYINNNFIYNVGYEAIVCKNIDDLIIANNSINKIARGLNAILVDDNSIPSSSLTIEGNIIKANGDGKGNVVCVNNVDVIINKGNLLSGNFEKNNFATYKEDIDLIPIASNKKAGLMPKIQYMDTLRNPDPGYVKMATMTDKRNPFSAFVYIGNDGSRSGTLLYIQGNGGAIQYTVFLNSSYNGTPKVYLDGNDVYIGCDIFMNIYWIKDNCRNTEISYMSNVPSNAKLVNPITNFALSKIGKTRPDNPYTGFNFIDSSLNKPIWWTGSKWVDATGADV